jgi:hypothetical protein
MVNLRTGVRYSAAAFIVVLTLAACGSDAVAPPDLGPLLFEVTVGCVPIPAPPYVCTSPTTTFSRGQVMTIGELLVDTTASQQTAQVVVRAVCWQNIEILRGAMLVDYLPRASTCRDSTMAQGDNPPRVFNFRAFQFIVPDIWVSGTYTARSLMLVDPPITVSRTFTIQ